MEDKGSILETLTEEQQGQVFHLMELANIDNLDFAAQMLVQFNFDVEVSTKRFFPVLKSILESSSTTDGYPI